MSANIKIKFVVATRYSIDNFWSNTATGISLRLYLGPHLEVNVYPENLMGLSEIYNIELRKSKEDPSVIVFGHDDLHILDFHWMQKIYSGLTRYGIVGIVGNRRRVPFQPSWAFIDEKFSWDAPQNLSGIIGHGNQFPPSNLSCYGPPFQEVKILDGLMLAAFSETLIKNHIIFDEKFQFHFYDLDFCRQAEVCGVSMGTIPISLIHESHGNLRSEDWEKAYRNYINKWGQ